MYFKQHDQEQISKKRKSFAIAELQVQLNRLKCYPDIWISDGDSPVHKTIYFYLAQKVPH